MNIRIIVVSLVIALFFTSVQPLDFPAKDLSVESTKQKKSASSRRRKKILMYSVIALAAAASIGGGIYWLMTSKAKGSQHDGDKESQESQELKAKKLVQGVVFNIVDGNIQDQHFDDDTVAAVVNAANEALQGGSGIDGAIHQAAGGKKLKKYCKKIFPEGCKPGDAVITPGFNIAPRRIIHTVAPRKNSDKQWRKTLAQTYASCMNVADQNNLSAVAFPALGTGVFGCDPKESSKIAVEAVNQYLANNPKSTIKEVRFVCWGKGKNSEYYQNALESRAG